MKIRYRLFKRDSGVFYMEDTVKHRQMSLKTKNKLIAQRLVQAKNEAEQQPALNLELARTYLSASDPELVNKTWQGVFEAIIQSKNGVNKERWSRANKDHAYDLIRNMKILETRPENFLKVMELGTVATNIFLRRIHNFALDMSWLPKPVIPRKQWPGIHFKPKRAITYAEHVDIIEREGNPERKAYYELCWHLGGSQGDIANLNAEDIDWDNYVISYFRQKTKQIALLHFGDQVAAVLRKLPNKGPLFPYLRKVRSTDRATEFKQRCRGLKIYGVTLHSYRYAWAERAKMVGYPERFAMEALDHNSQAVHRAYAKGAKMNLPALEDYEKAVRDQKVIPMQLPNSKKIAISS